MKLFHRVNVQDFGASDWCQLMKPRAYRDGGAVITADPETGEQPGPDDPLHRAGSPSGAGSSLLRLSIGLEACDELIADLDHALAG